MSTTSMVKQWRAAAAALVMMCAASAAAAQAQNAFQSGSTGADGSFQPISSQTVAVPESGVFNFTTVNIPQGVTVTFAPNSKNSPLTILASGDAVINGTINVAGKSGVSNGAGGAGGPGGFGGGAAGFGFGGAFAGGSGDGPGAGSGGGSASGSDIAGGGGGGFGIAGSNGSGQNASATTGKGGPVYGSGFLLPLVGGSGGGGGGAALNNHGGGGGGGGGAILIASSTSIIFGPNGKIDARGGNGADAAGAAGAAGGGGSGGAMRLIANVITGGGSLDARGGSGGFGGLSVILGGGGGSGYLRAEAYNLSGYAANGNGRLVSVGLPNPASVPNFPRLRIASVGGVDAPASPTGSLSGAPDIVLPGSQTNPVTVAIEASNAPVGAVVQVTVIPSIGDRSTVSSSPSAGTTAASTATASVTLPFGTSLLFAAATVDLTTAKAQPIFIEGEPVERIEITAVYGGQSEAVYVTRSGRRINANEIESLK